MYKSSSYIPHIDGIRSIAVLPVLMYHLHSPIMLGGFTGVDVFFVISGYLIIGGILHRLERKDFSYIDFYHRRAKRIIPAYFGLIIFTLLIGFIIFPYDCLVLLGETVFASALYLTNAHIPRQGDITLGYYWGVENHHQDWPINKGISAVLVNTEKGNYTLLELSNKLDLHREPFLNIYAGQDVVYVRPEKQIPEVRNLVLKVLHEWPLTKVYHHMVNTIKFGPIGLRTNSLIYRFLIFPRRVAGFVKRKIFSRS